MKKLILALVSMVLTTAALNAAPPRLMVLPDKQWCQENGYGEQKSTNGRKPRFFEDYDRAFLDKDLTAVEKEMKSLFTSNGRSFPLKSYTEDAESQEDEDDLDEMYEGAESGSGVGTSAFEDKLAAKASAPDIFLKVGWNVEKVGLRKTVIYRIDAVDAYSNKSVATVQGVSEPVVATTPTAIVLMNGLQDQIDDFESKLLNHFDDIQTNGREISLNIRMIDNGSGAKLTDEYGGKELSTIITDWIAENTVNHQFTEKMSSRNRMSFEQVRIPLREGTRPMQAKEFVTKLQNYLRSTYGIISDNQSNGLGNGRLYIGEK